jgi:type I restriction enzyme, S subunit
MKDSGIEWLGDIPLHWDVVQSRRLFVERNQKAQPGDLQLTASQKYGLLPQAEFMEREGRRVVVVQKGHDILKRTLPGDFVISMRSFQGGLELSEHEGSVSSAYVPLTPVKWVVPGYFRWTFKSSTYIQALQATSDLVRDGQALRFENFAKVPLPRVPELEQKAIASYLDRETTRIDALITKKTRFIKLLREKRQALITHAVTQGLDDGAQMKDSGTEWLGQIPTNWRPIRVRFIASKVGSGKTPSGGAAVYTDDGVQFLRSQNVYDDGIRLDDVAFITTEVHNEMSISKVKPLDVLLNITGGSIGRAALVPEGFADANVNQHVCIVRVGSPLLARWTHMCFRARSTKDQIDALQTGANREGLNFEQVGNLKIVLPPLQDMEATLDALDKGIAGIESLIAKTERSIELLYEHRAALITAAVTGKIDLRASA